MMVENGEFRMYSLIDLLAFWTSRSAMKPGSRKVSYISLSDSALNNERPNCSSKGSAMKPGSRTVSYISLSDFALNNERPNCSSKGRSSKNNHSSGHELALTKGV